MKWSLRTKGLLPVEKVVVAYLMLTFALIAVFSGRLSGVFPHLAFRVLLIVMILLLPWLENLYCHSARIRAIRIFLPFLFLAFFYFETDYLNNLLFKGNLDPVFSRIEFLIFGMQPSLKFADYIHNDGFAELMYFGYFSYYCLSIGIPLYLYFTIDRRIGERFAFIIITSFVIYYLFFILVPVAGPQFYFKDYPGKIPNGFIFGSLIRIIQNNAEGQTAAFPSSHVSICLMLLWGCYRYAKKLLPYVIPVAIILLFSTVYLRAHYVIDVIAGILVTPLLWQLSSLIYQYTGVNPEAKMEPRLQRRGIT